MIQQFGILSKEKGVTAAVIDILDSDQDVCGLFMKAYASARSLAFAAVITITVVNILLTKSLHFLVKYERHHHVSSMEAALLKKIFFSHFVNTALIVATVNAKLPPAMEIPSGATILFSGQYSEFTSKWYGNVGVDIALAVFILLIQPHVLPLFHYFFTKPKRLSEAKDAVTSVLQGQTKRQKTCMRSKKGVFTQRDLDAICEAPSFILAERYAMMLNVLFVSFMYSGGMPVLMWVATGAFLLTFWVDKLLLLRMYRKPPLYDEHLQQAVNNVLPYALLWHLLISMWMYGNYKLLDSNVMSVSWLLSSTLTDPASTVAAYNRWLETAKGIDKFGITQKIIRNNVMPLFILFCTIVLSLIFTSLFGPWFVGMWMKLHAKHERLARVMHVKSKQVPAFTNDFQVEDEGIDEQKPASGPAECTKPTCNSSEWLMVDGIKCKIWTESGTRFGLQHTIGEKKRTWEVIDDVGLHCYRIDENPMYRDAFRIKHDEELTADLEQQAKEGEDNDTGDNDDVDNSDDGGDTDDEAYDNDEDPNIGDDTSEKENIPVSGPPLFN